MASRVAVDAQPDKPATAVTIRIPVARSYRVVLILFSRLLEYVAQDLVDHLARRHARKRSFSAIRTLMSLSSFGCFATCIALRLPRLTEGSTVAVARLMAQPVVVAATVARAASSNAVFFKGTPLEYEQKTLEHRNPDVHQ